MSKLTELEDLSKALDRMRRLGDNWNGFGRGQPEEEAIDNAYHFLTMLLPTNKMLPTSVSPDEPGVLLRWEVSPEFVYVYIPIAGDLMHVCHDFTDGRDAEFLDDIAYNKRLGVPASVLNHIPGMGISLMEAMRQCHELTRKYDVQPPTFEELMIRHGKEYFGND